MMHIYTKLLSTVFLGSLILSACTVAKLEARLEANPQCKDVINPKTGAVMPCPGTDKSFYRSVGLEPTKPELGTTVNLGAPAAAVAVSGDSSKISSFTPTPTVPLKVTTGSTSSIDCKPQLHKKTGGMLPCPSPD